MEHPNQSSTRLHIMHNNPSLSWRGGPVIDIKLYFFNFHLSLAILTPKPKHQYQTSWACGPNPEDRKIENKKTKKWPQDQKYLFWDIFLRLSCFGVWPRFSYRKIWLVLVMNISDIMKFFIPYIQSILIG